ncbi:lytic transglycosylase domain-containing protein [Agromyces sp. H3Y2-19a]|uniref:lytic transglycosylase domain-containing protein n=1 Tax=Agromyces TaxID=33877 RepID=UPI001E63DA3B|nr:MULTISPECIES: lytic transglycosylase domain-containing protein [Agromyces]MCD5347398.1 lytic transglycosylase domain-containing protein [Agromyces sp. S2-1-8]MDF0513441.1 lytic transglycosylase domain-containing protein [Agromyces chromiiresistens]
MQNQPSSLNTPDNSPENEPGLSRRARRARPGWRRGPVIAAGAVVAVGALVGSGFMLQSAVAAQNERVAATAELSAATDLKVEQLGSHSNILEARAVKTATDTLSGAKDTISAAKGKADAAELASSVAALDDYRLLAPERVFELADATAAHAAEVKQAIAKADKIAAEKKAAAEAAARAAAEKAAAEEAAAAEAESSGGSRPSGPANPSGAQAIARDMLAARGWGDDQFGCLVALWDRESGWNVYASNPSGAYGIPQALPGSKMGSAGADWETNPATQIAWGLGYIADRYGTPCGAWDQSESAGWY